MLREIGCKSIDDLFAPIPAEYRLNRDLKVPPQMAESEIIDYFHERADSNAAGYAMFLGAGAYHHYTRRRSRRERCRRFLNSRP